MSSGIGNNCISLFPQQSAHLLARIVCQWRNGFGGYPREKQTSAHIDGKIHCDIRRRGNTGAVKAVVKEYVQGLHNQKLPHNQGKALFP